LKSAGILDLIRQFPDQFTMMFVYKEVKASNVIAAISELLVTAEEETHTYIDFYLSVMRTVSVL